MNANCFEIKHVSKSAVTVRMSSWHADQRGIYELSDFQDFTFGPVAALAAPGSRPILVASFPSDEGFTSLYTLKQLEREDA